MLNFGQTIRPESPGRAIKKMRGVGGVQVVRDWDVRGSPGRRIVTRSQIGVEEEGLMELGDLEEEEDDNIPQEDVLRVEIEHEDGTMVELDAKDAEAEVANENWDDESMTEEVVWDATLMHLAETIGAPERARERDDGEDSPLHDQEMDMENSTAEATSRQKDISPTEQLNADIRPPQFEAQATPTTDPPSIPQLKSALKQTSQFGAIPDGFVSPVKERRRRTINQVRLSNANRRRTLPVNFVAQNPAVVPTPVQTAAIVEASAVLNPVDEPEAILVEDEESKIVSGLLPGEAETASPADLAHDENAWEDVEEESHGQEGPEDHVQQAEVETVAANQPSNQESHDQEEDRQEEDAVPQPEVETASANEEQVAHEDIIIPDNIINSHQNLSLRKSPRRQSTSPVRKSALLPSSPRSHLIAFTPIKLPVYISSVDLRLVATTPPQPTRSSSAPPEEPQMSPRRPKQPRISDDTALLQAFLNRAAESKTSKDSSVTAKRECMENRRASTSVRQALASPAPLTKTVAGDVLADLDPNSASPRKQSFAASLAEAAYAHGKSIDPDEDELALNPSPTKSISSRKSGRVKKKVQTLPATTYSASTTAGPHRISIRGADSVVVLKKTEAQEIAQMTRSNTKKNKSGAVLPPMRLTRLAAEKLARAEEISPPVDVEEDDMNGNAPVGKSGRRAVKWAETLSSFHEGAHEPEMSMLSDEMHSSSTGGEEAAAAGGTPSKPMKLRRLRTPRPTAASASTRTSRDVVLAPTPIVETEPKLPPPPRATKRSSRIATPAKLPGAAKSLLPDGLDGDESLPAAAAAAAASMTTKMATKVSAPVTRRKVASSSGGSSGGSSKLPAPAPAVSLSAAGGRGKENSLMASPPKKRSTTAAVGGGGGKGVGVVPKLDFNSAGKVDLGVGVGGSPAKKVRAGVQSVVFGEDGGVGVFRRVADEVGIGSPAKKRGRRV